MRLRPSVVFIILSIGLLSILMLCAKEVIPVQIGDNGPFGRMKHTQFSAISTNIVFAIVIAFCLCYWCRLLAFGGALWRRKQHCTMIHLNQDDWIKLGSIAVTRYDAFVAWAFPDRRSSRDFQLQIRLILSNPQLTKASPIPIQLERRFAAHDSGPRSCLLFSTTSLQQGFYDVEGRLDKHGDSRRQWTITFGTSPAIIRLFQREPISASRMKSN